MKFIHLVFIAFAFLASSCKVFYPNRMFQMPESYQYVDLDTIAPAEVLISVGDELMVNVSSYDNFGATDNEIVPQLMGGNQRQNNNLGYLVRLDSTVAIPMLGRENLVGMTLSEAEEYLLKQYKEVIKNPFVQIRILNKTALIYRGVSGASAVPLTRENMSLLEVIAASGGLSKGEKAYKIKVIRGDLKNPLIDEIDLTHIDQAHHGQLVVQPDDIILLEERWRPINSILAEVSPYLSLVNTAIAVAILTQKQP